MATAGGSNMETEAASASAGAGTRRPGEGADATRHLGLFGATAVGVGAIVGGGILALAGVAFASTGPAAIVAFALNGGIAALTALSFARLGARFPENGGTYAYAKKVLSIEVAFTVGWVVWFASIMAAVLYALGFAAFAAEGLEHLARGSAFDPEWLRGRGLRTALALAATAAYVVALVRRSAGGGPWATVGKVVVFALVIAGGTWAFLRAPWEESRDALDPFFTAGAVGLGQAMGYTFIALQGFDLIAAVGGEVKDPGRNLPRSMILSLAIALAIYLPLLFLIAAVGVAPGSDISELATRDPEGVVAVAAARFLGPTGYWLVIAAGVLSMLSALQANLLGASRVAFAMARDRNLPRALGRVRAASGTPALAVLLTAAPVVLIVAAIGEVAAAGAAASLIFLIGFAMTHWAAILARRRSGDHSFPAAALAGAALCLLLAIFQSFAVPEAGGLVALWLAAGVAIYLTLFASGARMADASVEARDPQLARLRGRSPLVLVPVANPASAASLVAVAGALRTPGVGRLLLLSVVQPPEGAMDAGGTASRDAATIVSESLDASFARDLAPEVTFRVSTDPWLEIARVARLRRCETLLLGLPRIATPGVQARVEELMARVDSDVVVLRAGPHWRIVDAERILIPLGGRRDHSHLRARLLSSLERAHPRRVSFVRVLPTSVPEDARRRVERDLRALARDEAAGPHEVELVRSDDVAGELARRAAASDLVILGIRREDRRRRAFGEVPLQIARQTEVPLILISRRG
jgi:APA family basic amino acid/polyamine antiporter